MDRYRSFQEIRDSLSDWQSLDRPRGMDWQFMGARAMSQRAGAAESEFRALIEAWAARRHDLPVILAHHDDDIAMFDVPPSLQSRGLAEYKKTWDLCFAYHQPGQAFDVEELQMCVGDTATFVVAIIRCGPLPVSADHRPLQGRRRLADPARAPFGAGDGLEEPERRAPAPLFRTPVSARNP
jgi:ketosteroid isomerase-like protein